MDITLKYGNTKIKAKLLEDNGYGLVVLINNILRFVNYEFLEA